MPAVFRNGRYELRLRALEAQLVELSAIIAHQGILLLRLGQQQSIDYNMPELPEVRNRAFGKGR